MDPEGADLPSAYPSLALRAPVLCFARLLAVGLDCNRLSSEMEMNDGKIIGLAVAPVDGAPSQRVARQILNFVEGKGVEGDKNFGRSVGRGVNVVTDQSYTWFKASFQRERPLPGGFGEQVVISGIDLNWVPLGQRIQLGEAILQVVTPRTPCEGFTSGVDGDKVSHFVGHVGVMCAVVRSGHAKVGDPVRLV